MIGLIAIAAPLSALVFVALLFAAVSLDSRTDVARLIDDAIPLAAGFMIAMNFVNTLIVLGAL